VEDTDPAPEVKAEEKYKDLVEKLFFHKFLSRFLYFAAELIMPFSSTFCKFKPFILTVSFP